MGPGCKLLLVVVCVAGGLSAGAATGQVTVPCVPGVPVPGCEEPSAGPPGPGGEPQPPPQPPPPPPQPCSVKRTTGKGSFVGIVAEQIYGTESNYRGCALSALARTGVRIIRQPLRWSSIELERGKYIWAWWDSYMTALARHRMQLMPILYEPPPFRARKGAQRGGYQPARFSEMGAFAARVARRYGPRGTFWKSNPKLPKAPIRIWQVWNEPNLRYYWPPKPNAREYVRLLAASARGIRRVDPGAEIVTAGVPQSTLKGAVPQRKFIRQMYRAGAARHFDTLAIHSYTESHRLLVKQVKGIRAEMRRHGDRSKLWITEIGWATGGPDKRFTPGLQGQKRRIDRTFRMLKAERRALGLRGVVYFMWQDAPPFPGFRDFWGLHTGLLEMDGDAKPGMKPFRRHARSLRRAR